MRIFVCTDHDGHYPVGVASVIAAEHMHDAKKLLDDELKKAGLRDFSQSQYTFKEINTMEANAVILNDGNY